MSELLPQTATEGVNRDGLPKYGLEITPNAVPELPPPPPPPELLPPPPEGQSSLGLPEPESTAPTYHTELDERVDNTALPIGLLADNQQVSLVGVPSFPSRHDARLRADAPRDGALESPKSDFNDTMDYLADVAPEQWTYGADVDANRRWLGGLAHEAISGPWKKLVDKLNELPTGEQHKLLVSEIGKLGLEVPSMVVTALPNKSSAKTATIIHLAQIAKLYSGREAMVLDFNTFGTTGRVAERVGLRARDVFNVKRFAEFVRQEHVDTVEHIVELQRRVATIPGLGGLRILSKAPSLSSEDVRDTMRVAPAIAPYLFIDMGNHLNDGNQFALEVLKATDVLVVVANDQIQDSKNLLGEDIEALESIAKEHGLDFSELIKRRIIVISNLGCPKNHIKKVAERSVYRNVVDPVDIGTPRAPRIIRELLHEGAFLSVPSDDKIAADVHYDSRELDPRTQLAYMQILIEAQKERRRQFDTDNYFKYHYSS